VPALKGGVNLKSSSGEKHGVGHDLDVAKHEMRLEELVLGDSGLCAKVAALRIGKILSDKAQSTPRKHRIRRDSLRF
jgi:hypothetical protein